MADAKHDMLRDKRATRGARMANLVGEAAEEDETFWGHEIWQEGDDSDAASYSSEEEKPDVFDSDFNDSEDDVDEEGSSGSDGEGVSKKSNRYKDPTAGAKRPAPSAPRPAAAAGEEPRPKKVSRPQQQAPSSSSGHAAHDEAPGKPRTLRESTKSKTIESGMARERRAGEGKVRARPLPRVKPLFRQDAMLEEALQTEEENAKWLAARKFQQEERDLVEKARRQASTGIQKDFIRYHSRRGSYKTITFSSVDIFPKLFSSAAPQPPAKTCVITGLPARYKDPRTGMPFATLEVFKELRRRYPQTAAPSVAAVNARVTHLI